MVELEVKEAELEVHLAEEVKVAELEVHLAKEVQLAEQVELAELEVQPEVMEVAKKNGGHSHCSRFQEQTKNILSPGRRRRSFRHQRTTHSFRSQGICTHWCTALRWCR